MFRRRSEHDRVEELLSSYIDNEVSVDEAILVEKHLRGCAICAANLATLRQTVSLMQRLPELKPPRSFVLGSLPAAEPQRRSWGYVYLRGATALAAMLLFALLATDLGLRFVFSGGRAAAPAALQMAVASPSSQPLAAAGAPSATPYPEVPTEEALRATGEEGKDIEGKKEANVAAPEASPSPEALLGYTAEGSPTPSLSPTITPTLELTPSPKVSETATPEPTPTPAAWKAVGGPQFPPYYLNWLRALEIGTFLLFVILAGITASVAWRRSV